MRKVTVFLTDKQAARLDSLTGILGDLAGSTDANALGVFIEMALSQTEKTKEWANTLKLEALQTASNTQKGKKS